MRICRSATGGGAQRASATPPRRYIKAARPTGRTHARANPGDDAAPREGLAVSGNAPAHPRKTHTSVGVMTRVDLKSIGQPAARMLPRRCSPPVSARSHGWILKNRYYADSTLLFFCCEHSMAAGFPSLTERRKMCWVLQGPFGYPFSPSQIGARSDEPNH